MKKTRLQKDERLIADCDKMTVNWLNLFSFINLRNQLFTVTILHYFYLTPRNYFKNPTNGWRWIQLLIIVVNTFINYQVVQMSQHLKQNGQQQYPQSQTSGDELCLLTEQSQSQILYNMIRNIKIFQFIEGITDELFFKKALQILEREELSTKQIVSKQEKHEHQQFSLARQIQQFVAHDKYKQTEQKYKKYESLYAKEREKSKKLNYQLKKMQVKLNQLLKYENQSRRARLMKKREEIEKEQSDKKK